MTPFMIATNGSRRPKSVVSVTIGDVVRGWPGPAPARRSTVAVDHEIGDERERLPVLGRRERGQRLLGRLRIRVSARERIVDAAVLHDQPADLLDLGRLEGLAL